MSKRFRIAAVLLFVTAAASVVGLLTKSSRTPVFTRHGAEQQGLAFAKHDMDLFSKKGTGDKEGPLSYADQVAELNAYPAESVSADDIAGAQAANAALTNGVGKGKNSTSSWYSLGPTDAVYPAVLNRHGSRYVTSGRITALAVKPGCSKQSCTLWVGAAGGGVWRTDKALSGNGNWVNVSDGAFGSGAIGSLTYDAAHHTLYAGTGELAAAGDAEAGVGIYKSTDDGNSWTALGGNDNFQFRSIREIAIDPNDASGNTIYVADGRGVHGISSTTAGAASLVPGAPAWGVYKSTNGGANFTLLDPLPNGLAAPQPTVSSFGGPRGVTDVKLDPTHPGVVYAASYGQGVWRSTDGGATWTNIHPFQITGSSADRSEFALATMPDGNTRMYQTEGDSGPPTDAGGNIIDGSVAYSRFFVADGVQSGSPTFNDKTSAGLTFHIDGLGHKIADPSSPGYATYNFCTGQCWYDQGVYSPSENPNLVYVFGSYVYGEAGGVSNARALLFSKDGGETFTDLTEDGTPNAPQGLHPDQHALVTVPGNPNMFFEGSDGGLMRSDGSFTDTSGRCAGRGLQTQNGYLARCQQLLSSVPGQLADLNKGLNTLQFQSLSVNPANSNDIQGGTQDNGTFETTGSSTVWPQTIFGDGGLSGFDASDRSFRFHTYFAQQVDVSFRNGDPTSWDWISDPLFADSALFYFPIITDPVVSGTMYAGTRLVWRTLDHGGPQAYLDQHCNEFTGDFTVQCGDWVPLGDGHLLTSAFYGTRNGGNVGWVARTSSDNSTLWASTTTGRLWISHNANAADPAAVTYTRLDTLAANSPGRAISSIFVDPTNSNHAWVSYLGYNGSTTATPGHIFSVTYDPGAGTATWTSLDNNFGDQPANGVVENTNGDLYAATDFGVMKLSNGSSTWAPAANGLPVVTVAGLTINPSAHQLLAATHGRGAYQLTLP